MEGSNELKLRSWLFENLRHAFPQKFELPIDNNLLSWFIFGDNPSYGETSKVNFRLTDSEVNKRDELRELFGIEYHVSKLTTQDFNTKGIKISLSDLEILRQKISYIIYHYIINKERNKPYVSSTTRYGSEVDIYYWSPE